MFPAALAVHAFSHAVAGALTSLWTYVALGASVIVIEDVVPVVAGFTAHNEHLPLAGAFVAISLGSWAAALIPYAVARWGTVKVLARWPTAATTMQRLTGVVARRPWRSALATRFILGARTLLPLACGAARVPVVIYLLGSAISSVLWTAAGLALGWVSGETVLLVLGRAKAHRHEIEAGLAIVVLIVVLILQRRNREHVVAELESADELFPPAAP